jgi:TolB-like protein
VSFWRELKRRDVFKVAVGYLVASWLTVQVIDVLTEPLGLPDILDTVVVVLLAVGFPIALVVAWIYEVTPEGIEVTPDADEARPIRRPASKRRLSYVVVGLLAVAAGIFVLSNYDLAPSSNEFGAGSRLAILPCDNLSPDPDDAFFAAGIHEELLNRLGSFSGLELISRTSVLQYRENRPSIPEIAAALRADAIIECSVRYAGDEVRLTAQLIDGAADRHLYQDSYDADLSNVASVFEIQADIAMRVANALRIAFFEAERERIERIPTQSREAYELYLVALSLESRGPSTVPERLERLEQALQIDPTFVDAWLEKASVHSQLALGLVGTEAEAQSAAALDAFDEALELEPEYFQVHSRRAGLLTLDGEWVAAELAWQRAEELGLDSGSRSELFTMSVGDFVSARASFERGIEKNPLYGFGRAFLLLVYDVLGDSDAHRLQWERGNQLLGDDWVPGIIAELTARLAEGDVEFLRAEIEHLDYPSREIWAAGVVNFESPADGLAAIRAVYAEADNHIPPILSNFAIWAAHFGDTALALEWFREGVELSPTELHRGWFPVFAEMRGEPGFKDLLRAQRLPEYWRRFGWPDPPLCREISDDDFTCEWPLNQ